MGEAPQAPRLTSLSRVQASPSWAYGSVTNSIHVHLAEAEQPQYKTEGPKVSDKGLGHLPWTELAEVAVSYRSE